MPSLRFRYQTIEFGDRGELDIHLRTLRDKQQFSDRHQVAEKLGISSASWPNLWRGLGFQSCISRHHA